MCAFTVRTFREGDEAEVVRLFNEVYGLYGGFVPRTEEYWRWCCLERPDVAREGVFLAFDGERLCGYAVAGSSGNIWELCVADGETEVARALLAEAVKYLEGLGVSSANVNVPRDSSVAEDLLEAGFGEVAPERMFVTTLSPASLVRTLAASRREMFAGVSDGVYGFQLRGAPAGIGDVFSVRFKGGAVEVFENFPGQASVVAELGFMDFLSVVFGRSGAGRLFLVGKLQVRPFWKLRTVLKLLSVVRLSGSWFFPLSDFG